MTRELATVRRHRNSTALCALSSPSLLLLFLLARARSLLLASPTKDYEVKSAYANVRVAFSVDDRAKWVVPVQQVGEDGSDETGCGDADATAGGFFDDFFTLADESDGSDGEGGV